MSDDLWNDDIAYAFSIHRKLMQMLGIWPLQKKTVFTMIHWSFITILQKKLQNIFVNSLNLLSASILITQYIVTILITQYIVQINKLKKIKLTPFIFLFMELAGNHRDASTSIEAILFLTCMMAMFLKHLCITANRGKLARNIGAAITDWLSAKDDEETYNIMKKYAFNSRLFTLIILYSAYTSSAIYVLAIIFMNAKQIFWQDVDVSNGSISTMSWTFLIPSGDVDEKITGLQYSILIAFQSLQLSVMATAQCMADSFYINITLHLTGQLKVLTKKFKAFAKKPDSEVNYRKQLTSLIDRHCELTELNQNLEDTFHLVILFQLVIVTLLFALLGLRIILCLKNNDYVELPKSILALNYVFMESLVYCYGGDFVQRESEGIFRAIFMTSWFTLPTALMKDLHFVMMRSSSPFHLTGGKFFYANRETMVYVFKTAASYVSVLRMALRN